MWWRVDVHLLYLSEKDTTRRATFMTSGTPLSNRPATPPPAPQSQTSDAVAIDQTDDLPSGIDDTVVSEDEAVRAPNITSPPRVSKVMQGIPAQASVPPPLVNQPTITGSVIPTPFEPPQFVAPQEIFGPPQSVRSVEDPSPTTLHDSPSTASSPALGSSRAITPNQAAESHSLVAPSPLGSSQVVPHIIVTPPTVAEPSCSVLGSSQVVTPHQSDVTSAEHIVSSNSGATVAMTTSYKHRSRGTKTPSTQIRRDSIDGAPDVMLSLSPSGYQPSQQQEPLVTPMEAVSTTPSASPSPDDLIVPSSQSSLEDCLEIPMETTTNIPSTPSGDVPTNSSPQRSLGEPLAISMEPGTNSTSNRFQFAPRVIPYYTIDRSDLPSWLLDSGRLDFVLEVEGGDLWKKLIVTWLRQERRVGFGLDAKLVS